MRVGHDHVTKLACSICLPARVSRFAWLPLRAGPTADVYMSLVVAADATAGPKPFLAKLYQMVDEEETADIVGWTQVHTCFAASSRGRRSPHAMKNAREHARPLLPSPRCMTSAQRVRTAALCRLATGWLSRIRSRRERERDTTRPPTAKTPLRASLRLRGGSAGAQLPVVPQHVVGSPAVARRQHCRNHPCAAACVWRLPPHSPGSRAHHHPCAIRTRARPTPQPLPGGPPLTALPPSLSLRKSCSRSTSSTPTFRPLCGSRCGAHTPLRYLGGRHTARAARRVPLPLPCLAAAPPLPPTAGSRARPCRGRRRRRRRVCTAHRPVPRPPGLHCRVCRCGSSTRTASPRPTPSSGSDLTTTLLSVSMTDYDQVDPDSWIFGHVHFRKGLLRPPPPLSATTSFSVAMRRPPLPSLGAQGPPPPRQLTGSRRGASTTRVRLPASRPPPLRKVRRPPPHSAQVLPPAGHKQGRSRGELGEPRRRRGPRGAASRPLTTPPAVSRRPTRRSPSTLPRRARKRRRCVPRSSHSGPRTTT